MWCRKLWALCVYVCVWLHHMVACDSLCIIIIITIVVVAAFIPYCTFTDRSLFINCARTPAMQTIHFKAMLNIAILIMWQRRVLCLNSLTKYQCAVRTAAYFFIIAISLLCSSRKLFFDCTQAVVRE